MIRRNSRGGRSTAENFVRTGDAPVPDVLAGVMSEINTVAATTGDDPERDTLLLRLHTETAGRRGSALHLRPRDLDREPPARRQFAVRARFLTSVLKPPCSWARSWWP